MNGRSGIELTIGEVVGILKAIDLVIRVLDKQEPADGRLLVLNDIWHLLVERLEQLP